MRHGETPSPLGAAPASKEAFHREVEAWAEKIGVQPKRVQIQRMTRKWASWSSSGRICFSADLLSAPRAFREVVIVHELIHCLVPNHGKLFKSLMKAYLPNGLKGVQEDTRGSAVACFGRGQREDTHA
ncbi:MAG: M48 family metallopeptidase [Acidobacteriota bacterium]